MKITRDWLMKNKSLNGGWNFSQLAMLGVEWPPRKGWIDRVVGQEISEDNGGKFIAYGLSRPTKKERKAIKNAARRSYHGKKFQILKKTADTDAFLESYEWRRVRMVVLKRDGARCGCCGATPADGLRMHVDHIKPRKLFPHLALDLTNLQVLCEVCNHGKGNWDQTDWRAGESAANDAAAAAHIRSIVSEGERGR